MASSTQMTAVHRSNLKTLSKMKFLDIANKEHIETYNIEFQRRKNEISHKT